MVCCYCVNCKGISVSVTTKRHHLEQHSAVIIPNDEQQESDPNSPDRELINIVENNGEDGGSDSEMEEENEIRGHEIYGEDILRTEDEDMEDYDNVSQPLEQNIQRNDSREHSASPPLEFLLSNEEPLNLQMDNEQEDDRDESEDENGEARQNEDDNDLDQVQQEEEEHINWVSNIKSLDITNQFIQQIRSATLEDCGLDETTFNSLQNPESDICEDLNDPNVRLSIDLYISHQHTSE
ncbi:hypothetical protein BJ165DRAFT_1409908 [Panaeolus papilionaceus]|nr:hypothetical protein BJ165DRAFT_1409908 [Panaeolus papilionaceus]